MAAPSPRPLGAVLASAVLLVLGGCGKGAGERGSARPPASISIRKIAPVAAQGAVSLATRNTTRLGGIDVAVDAAAVARAVYPGLTPATRPRAVVVVERGDWAGALAASVLAGAPLGSPLLYSEGASLPEISATTLGAIAPTGLASLHGAQVIALGAAARSLPAGLLVHPVAEGDPAATAAAVETLLLASTGTARPRQAIVVPADAPRALQMPAAGLAAESGAPILFVAGGRVPAATVQALKALGRPSIYLVDSADVGAAAARDLRRLGSVTSVESGAQQPNDAPANAIAVARFTDGSFGWGVKEPGHGLVFAATGRPFDAPAAALLSASGDYGPLLLLATPGQLPAELAAYLSDIQPAYTSAPQFRPVRGVYNHGWLIGGESAISATVQAEIDSLLEISPRTQPGEEAGAAPAEP